MTTWRALKVFYAYAAKWERWRSGKPESHAERVRSMKDAKAASLEL